MNTFLVTVERNSSRFLEMKIQASSQEEAEQLALERAGGEEFPSEKDADYRIAGKSFERCLRLACHRVFADEDDPYASYLEMKQRITDDADEMAAHDYSIYTLYEDLTIAEVINEIEDLANDFS